MEFAGFMAHGLAIALANGKNAANGNTGLIAPHTLIGMDIEGTGTVPTSTRCVARRCATL